MKDAHLITSDDVTIGPGEVAVVGAPWEEGSSYLRGTALAPDRIRQALFSPARSLVTESGLDLETETRIHWLEDVRLRADDHDLVALRAVSEAVARAGARLLVWGGDHSITPPALRPLADRHDALNVVQVDAHPDLYDEFQGDRRSHACPMSRIMEEGRVGRLIQVGIRNLTPPQQRQRDRFGVEILAPGAWSAAGIRSLELQGPVYLSLDLDGLDPAFAPGVSHPEPGGLTSRQLIEIIQALPGPIVGADLVELNPLRDVQDLTALAAAKMTKEIVDRLLDEASP